MSNWTVESWSKALTEKIKEYLPDVKSIVISEVGVIVDGIKIYDGSIEKVALNDETYCGLAASDEFMQIIAEVAVMEIKGEDYFVEKSIRDFEK